MSPTATGKNYVIDGQHKFAACAVMREQLQRTDRQLPRYLQVFRCKRIRPDTPLGIRQTIAGREQARAGIVLLEPLSAKVAWFLRERASAEAGVATSELLRRVYMKCGCTRTTDGSMVRTSSFLPASSVPCCFLNRVSLCTREELASNPRGNGACIQSK